jgi:hypothetical protein
VNEQSYWLSLPKERRVEIYTRQKLVAAAKKAGTPLAKSQKKSRWPAGEPRKKRQRETDALLQIRNKEFIAQYKMAHPCVDCGEGDIRCLDLDHRDRAQKFKSVSYLVKSRATLEKVKAEIAKCDVRCANCHRKRSHDEKHHLPLHMTIGVS